MPSSLAPAFGFLCFSVEAKLKYLIPGAPFKNASLPYYHPLLILFGTASKPNRRFLLSRWKIGKAHLAGDKSGKSSTHKWILTEP